MKKFMLSLTAVLIVFASMAQGQFVITGHIRGKADGYKVFLKNMKWPQQTLDSAIIKKGTFRLKGHVAHPALYELVIDKTPKGKSSSPYNWLASRFYLENSTISYTSHIDSLPTAFYNPTRKSTKPVITGSATQSEQESFDASMKDLNDSLSAIDKEYMEAYHRPALDGKFNTKEGIELAKRQNELEQQKQKRIWQYIADHPRSTVAYDQASYMVNGLYTSMTVPQIDSLTALVDKGWHGTGRMKEFNDFAEKSKKTAIGTKYQDFQFVTPDGQKTMLSQQMPANKYVMLEFWASWCGPCRGEIPHLREVNKTKSGVFDIVSISIDEKNDDWQKAMKDEQMIWTQLNDPHGFEGEIAKAYNIQGIPHSILLDKEGRILKVGLRGAFLDEALQELGL